MKLETQSLIPVLTHEDKQSFLINSPRAVGFPADFVWILLEETQILPIHGHRLRTRKTRPAKTATTALTCVPDLQPGSKHSLEDFLVGCFGKLTKYHIYSIQDLLLMIRESSLF